MAKICSIEAEDKKRGTLMLTDLSIQNFRIFQSFKVTDLARINLIVGENSVGKSTLLEAIHLLVNQGYPHVLLDELEARGEISLPDDTPGQVGYEVKHLFWGRDLQDGLSLQLSSGERLAFTLTHQQRELEEWSQSTPAYLELKYGLNGARQIKMDLVDGVIEQPKGSTTRKTLASHYITTKGVSYRFLAKLWDRITLTPKEDDVIKMLQILDANVERISFQSRQTANSGILIKLRGEPYPLPLGSIGEGMPRILQLAIALADSENGYLLVDEIDTGLYYQPLTALWRILFESAERLNCQIFATTHSWDCVESFSEARQSTHAKDSDLAALFRLERRGEKIAAVRYTAEDLAIATEQGIEVR